MSFFEFGSGSNYESSHDDITSVTPTYWPFALTTAYYALLIFLTMMNDDGDELFIAFDLFDDLLAAALIVVPQQHTRHHEINNASIVASSAPSMSDYPERFLSRRSNDHERRFLSGHGWRWLCRSRCG